MSRRIATTVIAASAMCASTPAQAQTTVSFEVPINLTQVSGDIEKVGVSCLVAGDGVVYPAGYVAGNPFNTNETVGPNWAKQELKVMGGQVVVTLRLNVQIPAEWLDNPIGRPGQYVCSIMGFSTSLNRWGQFKADSPVPAFRLSPTPQDIWKSFVW